MVISKNTFDMLAGDEWNFRTNEAVEAVCRKKWGEENLERDKDTEGKGNKGEVRGTTRSRVSGAD